MNSNNKPVSDNGSQFPTMKIFLVQQKLVKGDELPCQSQIFLEEYPLYATGSSLTRFWLMHTFQRSKGFDWGRASFYYLHTHMCPSQSIHRATTSNPLSLYYKPQIPLNSKDFISFSHFSHSVGQVYLFESLRRLN